MFIVTEYAALKHLLYVVVISLVFLKIRIYLGWEIFFGLACNNGELLISQIRNMVFFSRCSVIVSLIRVPSLFSSINITLL